MAEVQFDYIRAPCPNCAKSSTVITKKIYPIDCFPTPTGTVYCKGDTIPMAKTTIFCGECPECGAEIDADVSEVLADARELRLWNEEREACLRDSFWFIRHPMPRTTYVISGFHTL